MRHLSATSSRLRRRDYAVLAAVGLGARWLSLGTFSLWLDEILLLRRASGSLAETWAACWANAEHPPASALASALVWSLTSSELALRWLHVVLGLLAAALATAWVDRWFGRRPALAAGTLLALSPFAVRYSHEIRPYAFLLFFATLTLVLADWVLADWVSADPALAERVGRGARRIGFIALVSSMIGGLYSHYLYSIVLVPLLWRFGEPAFRRGDDTARSRARFALATTLGAYGLAFVAFLPWVRAIGTAAGRDAVEGAESWTFGSALERLHFLLVGGREGEPVTVGGVVMLLFVLAGLIAAARGVAGRAVIAGALVGLVGVEIAFVILGHWSNARYDMMGWLFLIVLAALGVDQVGRWCARWHRFGRVGPLAVAVVASVFGLWRYDHTGRADWRRVVSAIDALRRPGEPVLVENAWTRISLEHHLDGLSPPKPAILEVDRPAPERWPEDRCGLLVIAGYPRNDSAREWAERRARLAAYPSTEASAFLLPSGDRRLWPRIASGDTAFGTDEAADCPGAPRRLPPDLRSDREGRLAALADGLRSRWRGLRGDARTVVVDFDPGADRHLGDGWSGFESGAERTFVWGVGGRSTLWLDLGAVVDRRIEIDLWPFAEVRQMTIRVNGQVAAIMRLDAAWHSVSFAVPATAWRAGTNRIEFEFLRTVAPADIDPSSTDRRPLTAAFDRVAVMPLAAGAR